MKVLSYNPIDDLFFIGVMWDEYYQLEAKYKTEAVGITVRGAKQFMVEEQGVADGEFSYIEYIKELYNIDVIPDICFSVDRELSVLELMEYDFPFHYGMGPYSQWRQIKLVEINDLTDLISLECVEREKGNV